MVSKKKSSSADSVEKVYEKVKVLAADSHFRHGERVNEAELAGQPRVSRTTEDLCP